MKRGIITALAMLAGWLSGASFAGAQGLAPGFGASPYYPPGGMTARVHPFGPIQMQPLNPQFAELQQSLNRLNSDGSLRGQVDAAGGNVNALGGLQTGHPTTFFNTGHYYPTASTSGSSSGATLGSGLGTGIGGYNPTFSGGVGGFGFGSGFLGTSAIGVGNFGNGRAGFR